MGMMEDMLAKANKRYQETVKKESASHGYINGDANKMNCVELANVYKFIEEHGFSTGILDDNSTPLVIEYDPLSANPGYSYKNKVYIRSVDDLGVLTHEIFHLASSDYDADDRGIAVIRNEHRNGVALNEGITDYLARCVDEKYNPQYPCEFATAKRLIDAFGIEILNGYFDSDRLEFEEYFGNKAFYINQLIDALDKYEEEFDKHDEMGILASIAYINIILAKLNLKEVNPANISEDLESMKGKTL